MTEPVFLGIDAGGTKTVALLATHELETVARQEFGPGNLRLLSDEQLRVLFRDVSSIATCPASIGIGLAGMRNDEDAARVLSAATTVWPGVPTSVTNDLEIALRAAEDAPGAAANILVLSGTGSCCYGRDRDGKTAKVGGWGHLLGDLGSGYDISLRALRAAIYEHDRHGLWGKLGQGIHRTLALNAPDELIAWAQSSDKTTIASLAPAVFEAATAGDRIARKVLEETGHQLASDGVICARRLVKRDERANFVLAGGILLRQPTFARKVGVLLRRAVPGSTVQTLKAEPALGAVKMAVLQVSKGETNEPARKTERYVPEFNPLTSPTEMRNPASMKLHALSIPNAVALMLAAEAEVIPALRKEQKNIEQAVQLASRALVAGGRISYVGAGTSGRLGVLDASECPPTFRASTEMVQGIIAGGQRALWQAVEGAEDNWDAGATSIQLKGVTPRDVVIGIAASGRTPFVWGALAAAREKGARTILICFNPSLPIQKSHRPHIVIAPNLGPEILTGSTRLKCGTATKLILNIISTLSMVRLGKVVSNLMVDLNPSNEKLRDRAERIVRELTGCSIEEARTALERNGWVVKKAWQDLKRRSRNRRPPPRGETCLA